MRPKSKENTVDLVERMYGVTETREGAGDASMGRRLQAMEITPERVRWEVSQAYARVAVLI